MVALRKPRKSQSGEMTAALVLTASDIEVIERRYEVMKLRRDGYTIMEIAKVVDISPKTVTNDLKDSLNATLKEHSFTTEEERQIAIERLDQLIKVYTPLATEVIHREVIDGRTGRAIVVTEPPNPAYAALLLNIEARRAKLLALDVPETKKLEVSGVREYVGINLDLV